MLHFATFPWPRAVLVAFHIINTMVLSIFNNSGLCFFGTVICQILFSVRRQPFWKYLRAMVNRFYGKKTQSCHVSCRAFLSEVLLPPRGIAGGPHVTFW